MIVAAAVLVLVGLALFVGGVLTGSTVLFWLCVAACVVAGIFLVLARARMGRVAEASGRRSPGAPRPAAPGSTTGPPPAAGPTNPEEGSGPSEVEVPASSGVPPVPAAPGTDADAAGDPPVEEVEVTDLLLVMDLRDEVLVVDEHPRYHVPGCRWLGDRETIPLPMDEARTDGFTPCGWCEPDRALAERERSRRAGRGAP